MDLTVTIPPDLRAFIDEKVASENYGSTNDVIAHALRLMRINDVADADALVSLRNAYREGLDSGDAGELDFAALKSEARQITGRKP